MVELQSIDLIIFNNTAGAFCSLDDPVHLTLNETATVIFTGSDGTPITISPSTSPVHPGDRLTVIAPGSATRFSTIYIKLFEQSLMLEEKKNYHVEFASGSYRYTYGTAYVLDYQIPDVDAGNYMVTFCASKNDVPVISGYGYIEIAGKGND